MKELLLQVIHDKSILNSTLYLVAAVIGMAWSWLVRRFNGEAGCILEYFLHIAPGRSTAAASINLGTVFAFIGTGALDSASLAVAIALGLTQGFAVDASINKGQS